MPSKTRQQHNLMAAAARDPKVAKKAGIPPKVAREFVQADQRSGKFRKKK